MKKFYEYFGDSIGSLKIKGKQRWLKTIPIIKQNSAVIFIGGDFVLLGYYGRKSAGVNANGNVYVRGNGVHGRPKNVGGVRSALWLK